MSDYKTILVHVDAGRTTPARLDVAVELAGASGAHVACLYAVRTEPMPSGAMEAREMMLEARARAQAENLQAARRAFDECMRRTGFERAEWRASTADPLDAVLIHARYADLVVIGQLNPEWESGVDKDFERSLPIAVGRPVLVVPYAFERRPIGRRVLVAWNASREAARAVSDALPLLQRAAQVDVVAFEPARSGADHGEEPGADIALYLARHGVKVTVSRVDAPDLDVGNQLLSRAFDLSADLIVMGAWGHSRLRELILGGVTRTLLESMTVPVLMAH
jgi:nucleotide-binding universal stress UspA family protein